MLLLVTAAAYFKFLAAVSQSCLEDESATLRPLRLVPSLHVLAPLHTGLEVVKLANNFILYFSNSREGIFSSLWYFIYPFLVATDVCFKSLAAAVSLVLRT